MILTYFTLMRSSTWFRLAGASLAVVAVILACGVPVFRAPAAPISGHGSYVQLHKPGQNVVMIQYQDGDPQPTTISIQNAGLLSIRDLEVQGRGGLPYLNIGASHLLPNDIEPFHMLPGERLVCSMNSPSDDSSSLLGGFFLWQMPSDPRQLQAALSRRAGWEIDPAGGLTLSPQASESLIEISFDSPLPLDKVKVAWEVMPADASLAAWFCIEGRAWGRASASSRPVSWTEPLDMSRDIQGQRRFTLRLAVEGSDALGLIRGQPITIEKLRIEREFQIQGQLLPMQAGMNELGIAFDAPAEPEPSLNIYLSAQ